jgi:hypothetical protein
MTTTARCLLLMLFLLVACGAPAAASDVDPAATDPPAFGPGAEARA